MRYMIFDRRFVTPVLSRVKISTIREKQWRDGAISLRVWKGKPFRSRQEEFAKAEIQVVAPITIRPGEESVSFNTILSAHEIAYLVRREGFADRTEFFDYFRNPNRPVFSGFIHWFKLC